MNVSIIELIFYGIVELTGMIVLITSVIKPQPTKNALDVIRAMYLIPSMVCAGILTFTGVDVTWLTTTTGNTIRSVNTTQVWTENVSQTDQIILQNPVWTMFHFLLFIVMGFYIIQGILSLLTKDIKRDSEES
jgi:hypothetical protein